MSKNRIPNVTIYNCKLIWKNFKGLKNQFGKEGEREFTILFEPNEHRELIDAMVADGWPIKTKPPQDEYENEMMFMTVKVAFANVPPKIIQITSGGRNQLSEMTVGELDSAQFSKVDLTLSPYIWNVNGKTGVKPYLKSMYATLDEDDLDRYYNSGEGSN